MFYNIRFFRSCIAKFFVIIYSFGNTGGINIFHQEISKVFFLLFLILSVVNSGNKTIRVNPSIIFLFYKIVKLFLRISIFRFIDQTFNQIFNILRWRFSWIFAWFLFG